MSWSISIIGKPEKVAKALEDYSSKLEGQSKEEYDAAVPHMVALVLENHGNEAAIVKVTASGHGYMEGATKVNGTCSVVIENIYGVLV